MPEKILARFGRYLRNRRNFVKSATVIAGIPMVAGFLWSFGQYGGVLFWLFLVLVALAGAFVSALLLWEIFARDFRDSWSAEQSNKNENDR